MGDVVLQPGQLRLAQGPHATVAQAHHIDQSDEVRAASVEAVPAVAFGPLAEAPQERPGIGPAKDVVFSRNKVDRQADLGQHRLGGVELVGSGQVGDVAGMQHEGGLDRKGADLGHGFAQGGDRVGIGGLLEADVAVTDLHEVQGSALRRLGRAADQAGGGDAAADGPKDAGPGPGHAFQQAAPWKALPFGGHIRDSI